MNKLRRRETIGFQIISLFLVMAIPANLFLIIININATNVVRNQVSLSNKNLMKLYISGMDKSISEIDGFIVDAIATNPDYSAMNTLREDSYKYTYSRIQLGVNMQKKIADLGDIFSLFLYSIPNDDLMIQVPDIPGTLYLKDSLTVLFEDGDMLPDQSDWQPVILHEEYYLMRVYRYQNLLFGACARAADLLTPLELIHLGENGRTLLVTLDGEPMMEAAFIEDHRIDLGLDGDNYTVTGGWDRYLAVWEPSSKGDFGLVTVIQESTILESLPYFNILSVISILLSASIILLCLLLLRKLVLDPINSIKRAMVDFSLGNTQARMKPDFRSHEFILMGNTFNNMLNQIENLKVQMYEEQLEKQRMKYRHLQLQVNPHFFLNSLNIVFQLAQTGEYRLIQKMVHGLVGYFQFMFNSNSDFVTLEAELDHTRNYLDIQQMRFPDALTYSIEADEDLSSCLIPPLLVQSFAENSIKYAVSLDQLAVIRIVVTGTSDGSLSIRVEDNGGGFPREVLDRFYGKPAAVMESGREQIGIKNALQRIRHLYGEECSMHIGNRVPAGSFVDIVIPARGTER